jgi:hypothetical protein
MRRWNSSDSEFMLVMSSCEKGNEVSDCIKFKEFFNELNVCHIVENSATRHISVMYVT